MDCSQRHGRFHNHADILSLFKQTCSVRWLRPTVIQKCQSDIRAVSRLYVYVRWKYCLVFWFVENGDRLYMADMANCGNISRRRYIKCTYWSLVKDGSFTSYRGRLCLVCLFPWASAASHGCTTACWLIVPPALDVPTLATRCPRAYRRVPHYSGRSWNLWTENNDREFFLNADFHGTFRVLLHAANLRHGTHGFTSLPKEDVLRIFPPLKIRWLRTGLNPRTWVPEASTLTPRPLKSLISFTL
jgi:hypothetical protein